MLVEYIKGEWASKRSFNLPPDAEAILLLAIEEADRNELVIAADVLRQICRS